jgi:hypothetical protein
MAEGVTEAAAAMEAGGKAPAETRATVIQKSALLRVSKDEVRNISR